MKVGFNTTTQYQPKFGQVRDVEKLKKIICENGTEKILATVIEKQKRNTVVDICPLLYEGEIALHLLTPKTNCVVAVNVSGKPQAIDKMLKAIELVATDIKKQVTKGGKDIQDFLRPMEQW